MLLNRAPTLHRLGIQAFHPVLIEGNAIQLHPLVCPAFNADFDGDQMAVHVPLSEAAQMEAREIMSANKNIFKPGNGDVVVASKLLDIVLGCYWMTKDVEGLKGEGKCVPLDQRRHHRVRLRRGRLPRKDQGACPSDNEKYAQFEGKVFETTVGRLLFNTVFPSDFPFINEEITNKRMSALVHQLVTHYKLDGIPEILDKIKTFGFRYATHAGITWSLSDVVVPEDQRRNDRSAATKPSRKSKRTTSRVFSPKKSASA